MSPRTVCKQEKVGSCPWLRGSSVALLGSSWLGTEPARATVPLRKEQRGWDAAPGHGGESPTRAKRSIAVMFESSLKNGFFIQFLTKQVEAPKKQQFLPVLLPNQCWLVCF